MRWRTPLLLAVALALLSLVLLVRLGDMDLFSHMAVGRWTLAHHQLPLRDPFAYSSAGPFRYSELLADVILYGIQRAFGYGGLWFFQAIVGASVLGLVVARSPGSMIARIFVAALVLLASFAAMALKPQVFSYTLFAAVLLLLERAPSRAPKRLLLLPLLFLAWANLHRAGIFGLAVLGVTALAWFLDPKLRAHARYLAIATVLSTVALLVNMGGTYYFTSAFDVVNRASFHQYIAEWQPLTAKVVLDRHFAILPLLVLAAAERLVARRKIDAELLVLLTTLVLATRGARLLPFVAIAAAPPAVRAIDTALTRLAQRARPIFGQAVFAFLAFVWPVANYLNAVPPMYRGEGLCEAMLPVDLGTFLAAHRAPGHLFHSFNFGGWFVWALAPETPVLFDGRNDTVYDDALFKDVIDSEANPRTFAKLDHRFDFAVAAFRWASPNDPRGAFLANDPDWVLIYWDDLSTVYANRTRAPALAETYGYRMFDPQNAFVRASTPADDPAADARFIEELRRNTRDAPRSARAHALLATALAARGSNADAEFAIVDQLASEKGLTK